MAQKLPDPDEDSSGGEAIAGGGPSQRWPRNKPKYRRNWSKGPLTSSRRTFLSHPKDSGVGGCSGPSRKDRPTERRLGTDGSNGAKNPARNTLGGYPQWSKVGTLNQAPSKERSLLQRWCRRHHRMANWLEPLEVKTSTRTRGPTELPNSPKAGPGTLRVCPPLSRGATGRKVAATPAGAGGHSQVDGLPVRAQPSVKDECWQTCLAVTLCALTHGYARLQWPVHS